MSNYTRRSITRIGIPLLLTAMLALLLLPATQAAVGTLTDIQFLITAAASCDQVQAQVFINGFVFDTDDGGNRDFGRIILQDGAGNTLGSETFFKVAGDPPSPPGSYVAPITLTGITSRPVIAILEDIDGANVVVAILDQFNADPASAAPACAGLPNTTPRRASTARENVRMICTDNRVNCEPWATAILYCQSNGVHVYGVNDDSSGTLAFVATFDAINALDVPQVNTAIASGEGAQGFIALYRLTTGEFQLAAADFQAGKQYNFIWAGCPQPAEG